MFDYGRRMQLAVADMGRRAGLKAAAAGVGVIALGFLLAALWVFLARNLDWGSLGASLAIGLVFLVLAAVMFFISQRPRHTVPTTDDLRREVKSHLGFAAKAALGAATRRAGEVVENARHRASSFADEASWRASSFADRSEKKARSFARHAGLADRRGATPGDPTRSASTESASMEPESRIVAAATAFGAFAIGLTLASRLLKPRAPDDFDHRG